MRCQLLLPLMLVAAAAAAADTIREFPIPTLVALGKELYLRDQMAAAAYDALFAGHPEARKQPIKGWITETGPELLHVYFIQAQEEKFSLAYTATFQAEGSAAKITDNQGAALPESVARRYAARRAAIAAIPRFMTKTYNFEVLDAPDGRGFLVYGLASTTDPDEVVVGGHYRVSVSAEGKVEQVDALSRSFLVLKRPPADARKDGEAVGLVMSHIVSSTPVETHVFVSLLHGLPLYVSTSAADVWKVSEGEITKMDVPK